MPTPVPGEKRHLFGIWGNYRWELPERYFVSLH